MRKANIYILAIKRKGKKGERSTLHQRLYYQGQQWQTSLGISVPSTDYDPKAELVTKGEERDLYNRTIATSKQTLKDILLRYELIEHRQPTLQEVTDEYRNIMIEQGLLSGKKAQDPNKAKLQDYMDEFIDDQSRERSWADGTVNNFVALKRHLDKYHRQCLLSEMTAEYFLAFMQYLTESADITNVTLNMYVNLLKWYLRWCAKKDYYKGNVHLTFNPKIKGSNGENKTIIYMTEEELKALENFTPRNKQQRGYALTRDMFLFSCYSGLRFSDVLALKASDIKDDAINIITKKTTDKLTINLNKHTRAILAKYEVYADITGKCFPTRNNSSINYSLRNLCKVCGIDTPTKQVIYKGDKQIEVELPKYELVSFHAARRTFITQAARLGIPVEVIMKFSGHHSHEMLKVYLDIADDLRAKEMSKFDLM